MCLTSDSIGNNLGIRQQNFHYFSHNYCGCFLYFCRQKSSPGDLETTIFNQSAMMSLVVYMTIHMLSISGGVREMTALVSILKRQ